jgi:CSLREA domain-containing protein
VRPYAAIAAAVAAAALAPPSAAQAASISVTTANDAVAIDGACSLREAVQAANTDAPVSDCPAGSGADQISLGATPYTLVSGQLDVTSELSITGAGAAATTIDGNHNGRVLNVTAAGKLTLDSVLITGGLTSNGGNGSNGSSSDPVVPGSGGAGGSGGNGGGIASAGTLTITSSRVSGNVTGNGGNGGNGTGPSGNATVGNGGFGFGGSGGSGGNGGGVYSTGTLTITGSTIDGNRTGTGGTGGTGTGGQEVSGFNSGGGTGGQGGQGGSGGGAYASGTPTITASTISGNTTGNGGPAGDGHGRDIAAGGGNAGDGKGGAGGDGGAGGGIWFATSLTASDDTVSGNTTGDGHFAGQGFGGTALTGSDGNGTGGTGGSGGLGGGIFGGTLASGNLDLERSLVASNHTGAGGQGGTGWRGPGAVSKGGKGGQGGQGGGLGSESHLAVVVNVTFTGNRTGPGGDRGTGGLGDNGPSTYGNGGNGGNGGAAIARFGTLGLVQATVTGNTQGAGGDGATPGAAGAGSLRRETVGATFNLASSIADGPCSSVGDAGGNLVTPGSAGCPGTVGDPKLGPLQDNGGPTQTMAIGTNGDAVDKLNPSGGQCGAATDQRGATRPSLVRCDIGAYEVAPPIATTGDASQLTTTSAKVAGTLDPRGLRTRWYFEYGTSSSYGSVTSDQFATGGSAAVAATLTGLSPNTTYHYRLVAVNPDGTTNGDDRTFTTAKLPPPIPTPPKITGLKLKPKKFRVSGKKPRGTTISYRDTLASLTTFTVLRPARGVRVKGKCLRPSKKRHGKRCTRYIAVGRFTHLDVAGVNRFRWGGKAGGRKLRRGSYKLRAVPVAGVLAGKAVTVPFRVIR